MKRILQVTVALMLLSACGKEAATSKTTTPVASNLEQTNSCSYGGKTYTLGQTFTSANNDSCQCENTGVVFCNQ